MPKSSQGTGDVADQTPIQPNLRHCLLMVVASIASKWLWKRSNPTSTSFVRGRFLNCAILVLLIALRGRGASLSKKDPAYRVEFVGVICSSHTRALQIVA